MNNKRSFTIEFNGEQFARLVSRTPKGAAQKAVSRLARKHDENGALAGYNYNDWNHFKLIETTRGSKKRTYEYKGMRKTLEIPIETHVAGKTIICKYDSEVHRIKKENTDAKEVPKKTEAKKVTKRVTKKSAKSTKGNTKKVAKKTTKKVAKKESTKQPVAKSAKASTKAETKKATPTSDAKVISKASKTPTRAKKTVATPKSAPKSK